MDCTHTGNHLLLPYHINTNEQACLSLRPPRLLLTPPNKKYLCHTKKQTNKHNIKTNGETTDKTKRWRQFVKCMRLKDPIGFLDSNVSMTLC